MKPPSMIRIMVLVGIAAVVLVLLVKAYTPTTTLYVLNDTQQTVTLSSCSSDPVTIAPGQNVVIDPNRHDPDAACIVYRGETGVDIGCLPTPTTRLMNGDTVKISATVKGVSPYKCGD